MKQARADMRWMEIALSYNGLFALCAGMPKHFKQIWGHTPSRRRQLLMRSLGWLALFLSLSASVSLNGWSFGPVEWVGMLSLTGLAITILLPHRPRLAAWLAFVEMAIAPIWFLL